MNRMTAYMVLASATLAIAAPLRAGDCCGERCDICGCQSQCQKICKIVKETKKVPVVKYDVECEDFCIPGPSSRCGKKCECECDPCTGHCKHHHNWIYEPSDCAQIRTKKKLVKIETTKEVPSYKWVVQKVCGHCCQCGRV